MDIMDVVMADFVDLDEMQLIELAQRILNLASAKLEEKDGE